MGKIRGNKTSKRSARYICIEKRYKNEDLLPIIEHDNASNSVYWVPQKLPQIYTVIAYICIEKVARFAVYTGYPFFYIRYPAGRITG